MHFPVMCSHCLTLPPLPSRQHIGRPQTGPSSMLQRGGFLRSESPRATAAVVPRLTLRGRRPNRLKINVNSSRQNPSSVPPEGRRGVEPGGMRTGAASRSLPGLHWLGKPGGLPPCTPRNPNTLPPGWQFTAPRKSITEATFRPIYIYPVRSLLPPGSSGDRSGFPLVFPHDTG